MDNLFATDQAAKESTSACFSLQLPGVLTSPTALKSSIKREGLANLMILQRSSMNIVKSPGPVADACTTPDVSSYRAE